jgi:ribose-phosphate pyrophosphokinase
MNHRDIKLFGLNATRKFSEKVADHLDISLCDHVEENFDDGECYLRSMENVRGKDVYVIQSLYEDDSEKVAEKFTKLLYFLGSLRDASADRITAVVPYMDGRQDRKTQSREPIKTKYYAQLLESMGVDRFLTMDTHNLAALQNAFRDCIPDNLEAKNLQAEHIANIFRNTDKKLTILSPDSGGMGRCKRFRNAVQKRLKRDIELAYLDKTHIGREISGDRIIGDVEGRVVIALDDMISSGSTINESRKAVEKFGGVFWGPVVTHGLFVGKCNQHLEEIERIVVTDTVVRNRVKNLNPEISEKVYTISTSKMFAQAIRRIHEGESISNLLK